MRIHPAVLVGAAIGCKQMGEAYRQARVLDPRVCAVVCASNIESCPKLGEWARDVERQEALEKGRSK